MYFFDRQHEEEYFLQVLVPHKIYGGIIDLKLDFWEKIPQLLLQQYQWNFWSQ